ncbi:arylesterase [Arvimicrobium flavum]|uniref:arylesterase n=1 Tax=Arvimicrobium flavum TaxID=3393320 RepID=UPI00237AC679|nr:arylesterase [Mesorhizobium shangrilense]
MSFKRLFVAFSVIAIALIGLAARAEADPYRIVGFGDSLMAGYQLGPGEGFPDRLQAALRAKGHDVEVAGAGVSGDTTSGGLSRLDWSVPDGTDLVILELGANDMLRGITPELTETNLESMLSRLKERNIPVLLAGMMAAPNLGPDYASAFNGIYPRLAEKFGVPLYPFFLDGVAAQRDLLLADGMHPSAAGVDVMVQRILPVVEKVIAASSKGG